MLNLQNVQSIFCELSNESIENANKFSHYISVAMANISVAFCPILPYPRVIYQGLKWLVALMLFTFTALQTML